MGLSGLHLSLPSKTNGLHINAAPEANPPHDSDVGCGHVNALAVDDIASPSPSSSGIVADINDSHADSNQVQLVFFCCKGCSNEVIPTAYSSAVILTFSLECIYVS